MAIIITAWGLTSYMKLRGISTVTNTNYRKILRPDILRLHNYGSDTKFSVGKFWGPATSARLGGIIPDGYKMKWHNFGNGQIQLRLPIAHINDDFYLCRAYVKKTPKQEERELLVFAEHIDLIRAGNFQEMGRL